MQRYKPFVQRGLSLAPCTTKEALDFLKEGIDLAEKRSVLGDYFLSEQKVLKAGSDAMQRELVEMTNEPSLQESLSEYQALSDVGALLQKVTTGFPPGCDAEDYTVRAVLSEDLQTIVNYAGICSFIEPLAKDARSRAERILAEAIQDGMPSDAANAKLAALLSGLNQGQSKKPSGIWSRLKRIVRQ